ncbi:polyisoprenoid-binding protein [Streptosporangium nondiastaticum]|uniref:Polyisoprenoid-binding protein n=1 Tax=Streptosporangium nondiastaticum TaxID=35764 RepID=A0A9X7JRJ9_9ACTN|nr:YceI family protein [Streptosporangium nondiastaticum]PSJ28562.1 polyisoprenoid-binding protein [Streptosporangium nondiastaticum]
MGVTRWFFEPGHTGAEFRARHMMVTYVRGQLKNVRGSLEVDPADPEKARVEAVVDATQVYTGQEQRDAHLRSADFFACDTHPEWTFTGTGVRQASATEFEVTGDLTIRGTTRPVTFDVTYLGQWDTPWWEDGRDAGPRRRAGFTATTRLNRQDFGVSWNDVVDRGGVVVSDMVDVTVDVEAVLEEGRPDEAGPGKPRSGDDRPDHDQPGDGPPEDDRPGDDRPEEAWPQAA